MVGISEQKCHPVASSCKLRLARTSASLKSKIEPSVARRIQEGVAGSKNSVASADHVRACNIPHRDVAAQSDLFKIVSHNT